MSKSAFWLLAAAAGVAAAVPHEVAAQGDGHQRNDCTVASQILRTTPPAPHREWAWAVIESCPDSAGAVLAAMWSNPPETDLAQLWGVSHRVRDARLTRAVLSALRNPSQSRAVRITAVRVLATHAAPELVVLENHLHALSDSTHQSYIGIDHVDVREGTDHPVTPALVGEVREALEQIGREDSDPEVRNAALAVIRQIQMHTRG